LSLLGFQPAAIQDNQRSKIPTLSSPVSNNPADGFCVNKDYNSRWLETTRRRRLTDCGFGSNEYRSANKGKK